MKSGGWNNYKKDPGFKSKYKYVYRRVSKLNPTDVVYLAQPCINGVGKISMRAFSTEIEAARSVDITLIEKGAEPVNILKRK